jgi:protein SCO1/2
MTQKQRIGVTILVLIVFMVGVVTMLVNRISQPTLLSEGQMRANGAWMYQPPRNIDAFTLRDHNGAEFTRANLEGKWTFLFVGYTYCPDICPTTMAQLAKLKKELEGTEAEHNTQVVLLSADPERDTEERLRQYTTYFDPSFIGVTGEFLDLQRFATNLSIAFTKVPGSDPQNYLIDHGSNIVLINPRGHYHGFFKPPFDTAKLKMTYRSTRWQFEH